MKIDLEGVELAVMALVLCDLYFVFKGRQGISRGLLALLVFLIGHYICSKGNESSYPIGARSGYRYREVSLCISVSFKCFSLSLHRDFYPGQRSVRILKYPPTTDSFAVF